MSKFKSAILGAKLQAGSEDSIRVLLTVEPTVQVPKGVIALSLTSLINAGFKRGDELAVKKAITTAIAFGKANVTYELRENKAGGAWVNKAKGTMGTFGNKTWYQPVNIELELPEDIVQKSIYSYSSSLETAMLKAASFQDLAQLKGINLSSFAVPVTKPQVQVDAAVDAFLNLQPSAETPAANADIQPKVEEPAFSEETVA